MKACSVRNGMPALKVALAGLAVWGALTGCGYTTGYRLPEGVFRLSVPTFLNQTFPLRREIEFDLTRSVRQELEVRTDAILVENERADARLEGVILRVDERVLTEGRLDAVQDSSIVVEVRIKLIRCRDEVVLLDRIIRDHASFSVLAGESLEDARREAIDEIAERIVAEMEAWPTAAENVRASQ